MILSTKSKIFIASVISRPLVFFFEKILRHKKVKAKRRGIFWELDLTEGIDFSIFIFGLFEKETSKAIRRLVNSDSIVIDIGANIGAHTLPISRLIGEKGKIYAIEPTDYAYNKLKRNLLINKNLVKKVQADQIVLINSESKSEIHNLYSSWPLTRKSDNQKHSVHQGVLKTISGAKKTTLDNYVFKNKITSIDLIKLDVDGNELEVLGGSKNVLEKIKPTIIMELAPEQYNDKNDFMKAMSILVSAGYRFYSLDEKFQYPSEPLDIISYVPTNGSINVVAKVVE
jgi:FkbM family methyltransferase